MLPLDDYRARLGADAPAFAEAVAAAPDAAVDACPGWTTSDVALHLGGVHRWVAAILRTGEPLPEIEGAGDPLGWYAGGWPELLATLDATDPTAPCWGMGPPPRLTSFWWRRQAHETAMHLWDVRTAAGRAAPIDDAFAADGIDEVLTVFAPRQVRLGRRPEPLGTLGVECEGRRWSYGPGDPDVWIRGRAEDLLLLLWGRRGVTDLEITDRRRAEELLSPPLVP